MIAYKLTKSNYTSVFAEGKYNLHYRVGSVVTADRNTLGIMLFDSPNRIHNLYGLNHDYSTNRLLKVETLDGVYNSPITHVCPEWSEQALDRFYNDLDHMLVLYAPKGTLCCHKIRILEEVPIPCPQK